MGISHSRTTDCISVLADFAFRTSNYSPSENCVRYKVLLRRGPGTSIDLELVASAQPTRHVSSIALAEQRRKFVDPGSEADKLIADGYNLVNILPLGDNYFLLFFLRYTASMVSLKESRLSIVNAELKLNRLRGETLVVGSQKLVMAGAEQTDNSSDELLEAIAHETANGGRLIGAWPNGQIVDGLVKRLDVLFQIPTHCDSQHYAYQLTFTSLTDLDEDTYDEEKLNRQIGRLSDELHKAMEAGWGLVDTVMASSNVIIWFLEREVSDALVNEPLYEGRLVLFSINNKDPEEITDCLNCQGQMGWILRSIISFPYGKQTFLAFFQRQVERSLSSMDASYTENVTAVRSVPGSRDRFAPPVYRPYDDYEFDKNTDDECELPHYEDVIRR